MATHGEHGEADHRGSAERRRAGELADSIDEVASRIPREVGEAARHLRRGAAAFEQGPPPDSGHKEQEISP
ncbi:hypothetical protein ACF06X_32045 [Streptomyces sp. NPDC015346]|uniref:hypothetical protein n=1 Tax=Streptomyces sp. NPDC015346 TaxID=3364954 RepID=UPI0036F92E35